MKIYIAVSLAVWATYLTTSSAMKVGEMSSCQIYTWELPFTALALTLIPAVLGYFFAKENT